MIAERSIAYQRQIERLMDDRHLRRQRPDDPIRLRDIVAFRPFALLWVAMFVSMVGTYLLLLVLSAEFFARSGSNFRAGAVFAMQWMPALVSFPLVGYCTQRWVPRRLLMATEIGGAVVSLSIGLLFHAGFRVVAVLLVLRGLLEAMTKSGYTVAYADICPSRCWSVRPRFSIPPFFLAPAVVDWSGPCSCRTARYGRLP